jgi:hypothetical protein
MFKFIHEGKPPEQIGEDQMSSITNASKVIQYAAATHSDEMVLSALALLDHKPLDEYERIVWLGLIELMEARHDVDSILDDWALLQWGEGLTYVEALTAAVAQVKAVAA